MAGEQQVGACAGIECGLSRISDAGAGAADRGSVVAHRPANAVRRMAHPDVRTRLVAGHGIPRRHHDVESLVAPAGIVFERVIENGKAPHAPIGLAAQDDVGVVAAFMHQAERWLDPLESVVGVGVADAQTTVGPVDEGAALARQPLAVHVEIGIGAVEALRLGVSPQAPVHAAEIRHVLPGTVALDEGASVDADRPMEAARDVLHLLDQAIVEEVLGRVADDQLRGVELAQCPSEVSSARPPPLARLERCLPADPRVGRLPGEMMPASRLRRYRSRRAPRKRLLTGVTYGNRRCKRRTAIRAENCAT